MTRYDYDMMGQPQFGPLVGEDLIAGMTQPLRDVSQQCHDLAHAMANQLPDEAELRAGLRHLLGAKDCLVRAALDTIGEKR